MKIFEKKDELIKYLHHVSNENKSVGFVPTMGALHPGHLSLVNKAKRENDLVVCSIFVNPTQFNNKEDLKKYPRTLDADIIELGSVKCDVLFAPDENQMYSENDPTNTLTIDFGEMDKVMEGKFRPGHFQGVAIVVNKLFKIVNPQKAYFGEKDFQQLAIIKKMVEILNHTVKVVSCETMRESDGLAMSSRNIRLSSVERKAAPFIYQILKIAQKMKSDFSVDEIKTKVTESFAANTLFKLEYFEISDSRTLQPISKLDAPEESNVACIAAFLGSVRLIDNIKL